VRERRAQQAACTRALCDGSAPPPPDPFPPPSKTGALVVGSKKVDQPLAVSALRRHDGRGHFAKLSDLNGLEMEMLGVKCIELS